MQRTRNNLHNILPQRIRVDLPDREGPAVLLLVEALKPEDHRLRGVAAVVEL